MGQHSGKKKKITPFRLNKDGIYKGHPISFSNDIFNFPPG